MKSEWRVTSWGRHDGTEARRGERGKVGTWERGGRGNSEWRIASNELVAWALPSIILLPRNGC